MIYNHKELIARFVAVACIEVMFQRYRTFCCADYIYLLSLGSPANIEIHLIKKQFFLTRELSLINTCCWRADHEILMHDDEATVH